jgi:hypothetical protein
MSRVDTNLSAVFIRLHFLMSFDYLTPWEDLIKIWFSLVWRIVEWYDLLRVLTLSSLYQRQHLPSAAELPFRIVPKDLLGTPGSATSG